MTKAISPQQSALSVLKKKTHGTDLELCVLWVDDDATDQAVALAEKAAAELAALREALSDMIGLAVTLEDDDPWFFENANGGERVAKANAALRKAVGE